MLDYLVLDDVVTPETFQPFQEFFMSSIPSWNLDHKVRLEDNPEDQLEGNFQGSIRLFDDILQHIYRPSLYGVNGNKFECRLDLFGPVMYQIFKILDPLAVIRIRINATFNTHKVLVSPFHMDCVGKDKEYDQMYNACFYVNTCDGYTLFDNKNKDKVMSQANRLLYFSNKMSHAGTTTTDASARYVMNINYIPKNNCPRHQQLFV
tara:strand:+ start:4376 stop:4993 length:618 start_codon:yes stop_codon:yes gene_type:complete